MSKLQKFSDLAGVTLVKVENKGDESLELTAADGRSFSLYHSQDCCESVSIEDIAGDLNDLIGSPIVFAEESTSSENPPDIKKDYQDSFTWTFYRLGTVKGTVVVRWYGESNGYYSESVDFVETNREGPSREGEP